MATQPPAAFESPFDRPLSPFEIIRVTDDDWPAMLGLMDVLVASHFDEWEAFLADLQRIDARVAGWTWPEISSWALIMMADRGARLASGVRSFLGPAFPDIDAGDRLILYFLRLIVAGVRTDQRDPFIVAKRASWYLEAGRLADTVDPRGPKGNDRADDGAAGLGGGRMSPEAHELHRIIRASVRVVAVANRLLVQAAQHTRARKRARRKART